MNGDPAPAGGAAARHESTRRGSAMAMDGYACGLLSWLERLSDRRATAQASAMIRRTTAGWGRRKAGRRATSAAYGSTVTGRPRTRRGGTVAVLSRPQVRGERRAERRDQRRRRVRWLETSETTIWSAGSGAGQVDKGAAVGEDPAVPLDGHHEARERHRRRSRRARRLEVRMGRGLKQIGRPWVRSVAWMKQGRRRSRNRAPPRSRPTVRRQGARLHQPGSRRRARRRKQFVMIRRSGQAYRRKSRRRRVGPSRASSAAE